MRKKERKKNVREQDPLVAQWLRIRLLGFPGGSVVKNPSANAGETQALVQEDPTCHGATKPMSHNY